MVQFEDLPDEMIAKVMDFCDDYTYPQFAYVSKRLLFIYRFRTTKSHTYHIWQDLKSLNDLELPTKLLPLLEGNFLNYKQIKFVDMHLDFLVTISHLLRELLKIGGLILDERSNIGTSIIEKIPSMFPKCNHIEVIIFKGCYLSKAISKILSIIFPNLKRVENICSFWDFNFKQIDDDNEANRPKLDLMILSIPMNSKLAGLKYVLNVFKPRVIELIWINPMDIFKKPIHHMNCLRPIDANDDTFRRYLYSYELEEALFSRTERWNISFLAEARQRLDEFVASDASEARSAYLHSRLGLSINLDEID